MPRKTLRINFTDFRFRSLLFRSSRACHATCTRTPREACIPTSSSCLGNVKLRSECTDTRVLREKTVLIGVTHINPVMSLRVPLVRYMHKGFTSRFGADFLTTILFGERTNERPTTKRYCISDIFRSAPSMPNAQCPECNLSLLCS